MPRQAKLTRIFAPLTRKSTRRRALRFGLVAFNIVLLFGVLAFVLLDPVRSGTADSPALASAAGTDVAENPLDQLSSANIAVTVARMSGLAESTAVTNQADSESAELTLASANDSVSTKPQVVATAFKSRLDIHNYVTQPGDTVSTIAAKFGVSSDSIRWSNGLSGNSVSVHQTLAIPPVNGIVYTVKSGDTPASLASKFSANKAKIIAYNDAEISGLKVGEQIIIPDGSKQAPVTTTIYAATGYPWGGGPIYGYNGYDYGYCTWYVANRIAVPANWGNASTWAYYASKSGWTVSSVPRVGAIAQTPYAAGGEGHVAIVEAVSADGSKVKISDMNGIAGWGRVGVAWEATSTYPNYIYH